jgi:anthranilate synthase/aminodeoxychorismate synthase-like glutamine amidotransferase
VILLIDNYDSFTWNLVQRLGEIDPSLDPDRDLAVVRNDQITPDQAEGLDGGRGPTHLIISPGPCSPSEAGVSSVIIQRFAGRIPILGVCLGHQCIGQLHGMTVARHDRPMHGKTSEIHHDGLGVYAGLPNPFTATRYHSLIVKPETVPVLCTGEDGWVVSAWVDEINAQTGRTERVIMGLRRSWSDPSKALLEGVQFHPESFLTTNGPQLLTNFLRVSARS